MILIPAIDLKQGRCVRLYQGNYKKETEYSKDPVTVARSFEESGAQKLHVVDLDGAVRGQSRNFPIIADICKAVSIPVECGGGIRDCATVQRFIDAGVSEVILGTIVLNNPDETLRAIKTCGADKILIGLDFQDDSLAVKGWKELIPGSVVDEINRWHSEGIRRVVLTDISRDGTMQGPNIPAFREIARSTEVYITAAGGISRPDDIHRMKELEPLGVDSVISGKAIYEKRVRIEDFI
ncbi:1-(5-phosphoribosyl)-5-[(5-phosphoribosylamino)methylideneamino]imidazole-4-carboxamide isomerase [candidate division KSB1 bacterium]